MKLEDHLRIIGTSHIAKQSLKEVKEAVSSGNYDIVALELDNPRLYSLLNDTKNHISILDIFRIGVKGYLFALLGAWVEKKMGSMVGMKPGDEMLAAYKAAYKDKLKVALIDQRIDITLKRLSKSLSWKEKWFFIVDIIKAFIYRKPQINFDLSKVPTEDLINTLLLKVRERYPNFYNVLVTERNIYMARRLASIIKHNPNSKVVAIVGAGHGKELFSLTADLVKDFIGKDFKIDNNSNTKYSYNFSINNS